MECGTANVSTHASVAACESGSDGRRSDHIGPGHSDHRSETVTDRTSAERASNDDVRCLGCHSGHTIGSGNASGSRSVAAGRSGRKSESGIASRTAACLSISTWIATKTSSHGLETWTCHRAPWSETLIVRALARPPPLRPRCCRRPHSPARHSGRKRQHQRRCPPRPRDSGAVTASSSSSAAARVTGACSSHGTASRAPPGSVSAPPPCPCPCHRWI